MPLQGKALKRYAIFAGGVNFMVFGLDAGILGGVAGMPGFVASFPRLAADPDLLGTVFSIYDLGCVIGCLMCFAIADYRRCGRREIMVLGGIAQIIGSALVGSAFSVGQLIVGRIMLGIGTGFSSVVVPTYLQEVCKPEERGGVVALQFAVNISGIALAQWISYGFLDVRNGAAQWRVPISFQAAIAIIGLALIPPLPESPRFLVQHGKRDEARETIRRFEGSNVPIDDPAVVALELEIYTALEAERSERSAWKEVFVSGEAQNRKRFLLACGMHIMSQLSGINVVSYYLPVLFVSSFGLSAKLATILSAVASMILMISTGLPYYFVDRVGRKKLLVLGSFINGVSFMFVALGLGQVAAGKSGGYAVLAVFGVYLFYTSFGALWLAVYWGYASELPPIRLRGKINSFSICCNWMVVFILLQVTPKAIAGIGWRYYLVFMVLNFLMGPLIWYFWPETVGKSLEEIDHMFLKPGSELDSHLEEKTPTHRHVEGENRA